MRITSKIGIISLAFSLSGMTGQAKDFVIDPPTPQFYRDLTLKIRPNGTFRIPMPTGQDAMISYHFEWGTPKLTEPDTFQLPINSEANTFTLLFWDRIYLKDGSFLEINGQKLPLTCVTVEGQDNRFGKDSPLFPDLILKIRLVANDFSCTGPLNPGFPENGGKKEMWDSFLSYTVRDLTIMLPTDATLRYRWNEFGAIIVDHGGS